MRKIGNVELANPFLAAPLAGITDAAARTLYGEMGAALVYSEMVSGKGLLYSNEKTERLLTIRRQEGKVAFQIFGCEPKVMERTAELLSERSNVILDINMGCPVPKVVKNGEGSALLKNLELLHRVTEACVKKAGKPVTVKMRTGWDKDHVVAVEAAKAAQAAGAAAVTIHGRTREQYYSGRADWDIIRKVKKELDIPVIGNGDVFDGETALKMMAETECDMVMVGRGMLGNPWIFRDALALWRGKEKPPAPTKRDKKEMMLRHYDLLAEDKGEYAAVREMRKHVGWYLKGESHATHVRRAVNKAKTEEELKRIIRSIE
ncbi:MAG: tRNA dihydrouridine synthase DusB [Anaerovoracaceae bacterium]|jgi:tRNA-dihydrouridine synthase B